MGTYEWLLFLHVIAAFAVVSGLALLTAAALAARRARRPSDVVSALGLNYARPLLFDAAGLAILVFGVWLVIHLDGYRFTDAWILSALVLWVVLAFASGRAATVYSRARDSARQLAAAGDEPSPEVDRLVRDRRALVLHAIAVAAFFATLALMIYKPGAGAV